MKGLIKKICFALFVAALCLSCALPNMPVFTDEEMVEGVAIVSPEGYYEVQRSESAVMLYWDAPAPPAVSYNVYYREHGTQDWILLANVTEAEFELSDPTLYGKVLDFGVSSIDSDGQESAVHASLDDSALPSGGWYLFWDR